MPPKGKMERDPRKRAMKEMQAMIEKSEQTRDQPRDQILGNLFPSNFQVMIIDDDPICASYVTKILLQCKFKVTHCHPSDAISFLREKRAGIIHVLLIKVHMSEADPFVLLEQTRRTLYLPALMLTLIPTERVSRLCTQYRDCQHLVFPLHVPKLVQYCYTAHNRGRNTNLPQGAGAASSAAAGPGGAAVPPLDHFIVRGTETPADIRRHRKKQMELPPEVKATFTKALDEMESHLAVAKKALGMLGIGGESSGTKKDRKPPTGEN